ncbi:hypothetical protein WT81_33420 [Burkholderia stagnalis]|uniref:hypothetical protein n=1 Tax=Burkholderia stagnalis TaxID=1503054 RepID=UPI00075FAFED|nr:hypothetical protein [Burkholderia stagnalis]KWK50418.1 hypothetical protein WT80_00755 [Burkholderia stagnalis]KWK65195.1 hypothetical protein WT81_33420 [Burkholderia stagnalis]KWN76520.1 hypothetical protein WT90_00660 [Burkholderia stagnalis]
MPAKLFATNDVAASIRKAHEAYTHVLVNRGYELIRPFYFRSGRIADLPVHVWASWEQASNAQLERWRERGGILLNRDTFSDKAGPADVLAFVECPLTMQRVNRSCLHVREYAVLPRPVTWISHEHAVDLRAPSVEHLRELWQHCRGRRMTDQDLSEASSVRKADVQYLRRRFRGAVENWEIRPRLEPDFPGYVDAWAWIGTGRCASRKDVRLAGHKAAVTEMARLGHVTLEKIHHYPPDEPNWAALKARRAAALADLAAVRTLIESLPNHLEA